MGEPASGHVAARHADRDEPVTRHQARPDLDVEGTERRSLRPGEVTNVGMGGLDVVEQRRGELPSCRSDRLRRHDDRAVPAVEPSGEFPGVALPAGP